MSILIVEKPKAYTIFLDDPPPLPSPSLIPCINTIVFSFVIIVLASYNTFCIYWSIQNEMLREAHLGNFT